MLNDLPKPQEPVVFLRGNPGNRGPAVPRQFPEILAGAARKPFTDGSGRLELAKAVASPENPLTARVMVNRVWITHFGQGLVRTPSDFGVFRPADAPRASRLAREAVVEAAELEETAQADHALGRVPTIRHR
ncbi:MAG: DUF1553 domain-containing protein [Gemmataceae bacterium]